MSSDMLSLLVRYLYLPLCWQYVGDRTVDLNSICSIFKLMSLESTVSIAKVGTNSVRATVPEGIVAFLDLKVGDKLVWKMDITNTERVAVVTKRIGITDATRLALKYSKGKGKKE